MLGPAGVGINRQPVGRLLRIEGSVIASRAQVTELIPGGTHKGVHRVGFPNRPLPL